MDSWRGALPLGTCVAPRRDCSLPPVRSLSLTHVCCNEGHAVAACIDARLLCRPRVRACCTCDRHFGKFERLIGTSNRCHACAINFCRVPLATSTCKLLSLNLSRQESGIGRCDTSPVIEGKNASLVIKHFHQSRGFKLLYSCTSRTSYTEAIHPKRSAFSNAIVDALWMWLQELVEHHQLRVEVERVNY